MIISTTYGVGGYDETKPNNNIVETIERINSDECVVREYDGETVVSETTISMPETPEQPTLLSVSSDAIDELLEAMDDGSVNSIVELKQSILNFANKIKGN